MQDVFKTDLPESDIFDIPDVCGENTNSFFKDIPITQARCDFEDGGGWTVILRRNKDVSEQVDFNLPWTDYERGFGDLNTEFWYGLRNIHCLTNQEEVELQIEVRQEDGTGQVWTYGFFVVDEPENNYTLHIGQTQGPSSGRDSMDNHNGIQFTTKDRDHDENTGLNCVDDYTGGGWWYKSCGDSVLTGGHSNRNIYWGNGREATTYFSIVEMKLRPKRCKSENPCNEIIPPPQPPTTIPLTNPPTTVPMLLSRLQQFPLLLSRLWITVAVLAGPASHTSTDETDTPSSCPCGTSHNQQTDVPPYMGNNYFVKLEQFNRQPITISILMTPLGRRRVWSWSQL